MLTYSQFMRRLKPMSRGEVIALAKMARVPEHTLIKVWNGVTKNPGVKLVEAVGAHLEKVAA